MGKVRDRIRISGQLASGGGRSWWRRRRRLGLDLKGSRWRGRGRERERGRERIEGIWSVLERGTEKVKGSDEGLSDFLIMQKAKQVPQHTPARFAFTPAHASVMEMGPTTEEMGCRSWLHNSESQTNGFALGCNWVTTCSPITRTKQPPSVPVPDDSMSSVIISGAR